MCGDMEVVFFCSTSVTDVCTHLDKVATHLSQAGQMFMEQQLVKHLFTREKDVAPVPQRIGKKKSINLTLPLLALL